ncbi:MAG TPA: Tol-Pal system beta propeller repeat protein TolB [Burkholderiales bacterium]
MKRWLTLLCWMFLVAPPAARAQLSIEITGAGANRIPIAVAPFVGEAALGEGLTAVVRADLERSGLFRLLEVPPMSPAPTEASAVGYPEWRSRLADALVLGSVSARPDGRFEARFRLFDVVKQQPLGGIAYTLSREQARATAHRIADFVYEKLTGEKGVFSTRIAYVVKRPPNRYELQIADADGAGAETALASLEPIISPAWSPDGRRLAYVSFEAKKPVVYVHSLTDGKRYAVAHFRGSNSAPAWSPDGKTLAVVLSVDGGSQMFFINADGSGPRRRVTTSSSIDTEPRFSPDAQWLYFTSDRGGSPQVYRMPVAGGEPQRVTFDGSYNVTPRLSPDGKTLAYVTRNAGRFQVALLDLGNRQVQIITDSEQDESPSFAPNGRMILLATVLGGRGVLAAVSSDGRIRQRLPYSGGDVREPAWGPYID